MSKILTFKGSIDEGLEVKIKLSTIKGKRGYRIKQFSTMNSTPGAANYETTTKVYAKAQGAGSTGVDFGESDLLAASYIEDASAITSVGASMSQTIIFTQEVFNQDTFVNTASLTGTVPTNFYLELETVDLSDTQSTQLTLKSLRQVASR